MHRFFAVFTIFCMLVLPINAEAARVMPKAKVIAVYVYADWCANCKILSPVLEDVKANIISHKEDVLFVKLDMTDKPKIHQSILLAQALGLGDYLKAQGSGTGYLALIDPASKKETARFTSAATGDEILTAIKTQLSTSVPQ